MYKDLFLTGIASVFACIGLTTNNAPQMIGAMLISPLINPIRSMFIEGKMTESVIQFIILSTTCLVIGIIYHHIFLSGENFELTSQMKNLSDFKPMDPEYLYHSGYGFLAGICLYVVNEKTYFSQDTVSQCNIGIGIGITLLPAFVNAGILLNAKTKNSFLLSQSSIILGIDYLISIFVGYMIAKKHLIIFVSDN